MPGEDDPLTGFQLLLEPVLVLVVSSESAKGPGCLGGSTAKQGFEEVLVVGERRGFTDCMEAFMLYTNFIQHSF